MGLQQYQELRSWLMQGQMCVINISVKSSTHQELYSTYPVRATSCTVAHTRIASRRSPGRPLLLPRWVIYWVLIPYCANIMLYLFFNLWVPTSLVARTAHVVQDGDNCMVRLCLLLNPLQLQPTSDLPAYSWMCKDEKKLKKNVYVLCIYLLNLLFV